MIFSDFSRNYDMTNVKKFKEIVDFSETFENKSSWTFTHKKINFDNSYENVVLM